MNRLSQLLPVALILAAGCKFKPYTAAPTPKVITFTVPAAPEIDGVTTEPVERTFTFSEAAAPPPPPRERTVPIRLPRNARDYIWIMIDPNGKNVVCDGDPSVRANRDMSMVYFKGQPIGAWVLAAYQGKP